MYPLLSTVVMVFSAGEYEALDMPPLDLPPLLYVLWTTIQAARMAC